MSDVSGVNQTPPSDKPPSNEDKGPSGAAPPPKPGSDPTKAARGLPSPFNMVKSQTQLSYTLPAGAKPPNPKYWEPVPGSKDQYQLTREGKKIANHNLSYYDTKEGKSDMQKLLEGMEIGAVRQFMSDSQQWIERIKKILKGDT